MQTYIHAYIHTCMHACIQTCAHTCLHTGMTSHSNAGVLTDTRRHVAHNRNEYAERVEHAMQNLYANRGPNKQANKNNLAN